MDTALKEGRFWFANQVLRLSQVIFSPENSQRKVEHFFRLKQVAEPFYRATYDLKSDGYIHDSTHEDAQAVHAYAAELVREDLKKLAEADPGERELHVGNIAEDVVLALGARGYNAHGRRFIVPSTAFENKSSVDPIDFNIVSIHDEIKDRLLCTPIQVKVSLTSTTGSRAFRSGIRPVGLKQIDTLGTEGSIYDIAHENALAQLIVNDIDGLITDTGIAHINEATRRMYASALDVKPHLPK